MKILYLFSTAESSVAIVTLNQVKALRKYYPELSIKIACVNYYKERSVLDGEIDYKKDYNSSQIINYIQSLKFVRSVKNDFKPDITISNLGAVNTFNSLVNVNDVKIGIFHSPMLQFKNKNILSRFLNSISIYKIYPKLNSIIGISKEVVNDLKKNIKNFDVKLFYNIHDVEKINNKSLSGIKEFNEKKYPELLLLGTIDFNKRQDLILKALIQNENKNIKVYIVGKVMDVNYFEQLQKIIGENQLESQVKFVPFLDNPYPLIKRVDALLSLSESEGLPGVLIEALILNTTVISTNSSQGVWDILNVKNTYDKNLIEKIDTEKGFILPNSQNVNEADLIIQLNQAINQIVLENKSYEENEFVFMNSISENSIHLFYSFLLKTLDENNS